jgi:putative DNA primase/helicase
VSLYVFVALESGERKSVTDKLFTQSLEDYQREARELAAVHMKNFCAAEASWKARKAGIVRAIEAAAKKSEPCAELEKKLRDHAALEPLRPRVLQLLYEDTTPEALAFSLYSGWPVGGVLSPEAGVVLGGPGMRSETVMANLAILNKLWDGARYTVNRKTSESFTLYGARLTIGVAAQPETVRQFLDKTRGLARGSGFLARFFMIWPKSTAGSRPYKEEPEEWPHLKGFRAQLRKLLKGAPQPDIKTGQLALTTLKLSPEAKTAWVAFHDDVEKCMAKGGEFSELKDVASKAAENVARLAALFHLYAHGAEGEIGADNVERAAIIVKWHLHEAKRFLASAAMPPKRRNAIELDDWLIHRCLKEKIQEIPAGDILRLGPNPVRDAEARDEALAELEALGRVRQFTKGKQKWVAVNPKLIEGCGHE